MRPHRLAPLPMPVSKKPRNKSKHATNERRSGVRLWYAAVAVAIPLVVILGYFLVQGSPDGDGSAHVEVQVPELSSVAKQGEQLFLTSCASCHGANAAGSDKGPPLVHRIYEPNHHGDGAFYRAVRQGVRAHHWPYGDMAPVPTVRNDDVGQIVQYVRELQKANGIV